MYLKLCIFCVLNYLKIILSISDNLNKFLKQKKLVLIYFFLLVSNWILPT